MTSSARVRLSVSSPPHWQERHTSSNAYIGLFLMEGGRGGGGAFEKVVIPESHCVFYFKDLREKCTCGCSVVGEALALSGSLL